jgi:hypothetical protein
VTEADLEGAGLGEVGELDGGGLRFGAGGGEEEQGEASGDEEGGEET